LTPDHPVVRGTAQNPDVFFQNREAGNRFYLDLPAVGAERDGSLCDDHRPRTPPVRVTTERSTAERDVVIMGSGAETVRATIDALGPSAKLGVVTVKLYRPFSVPDFHRGAAARPVR
jgi:pyruvate-ferredoxin/flavodoxin oxidoreductase